MTVIQEARIAGVRTGKTKEVVGELRLSRPNRGKVIPMTKALEDEVEAFQNWPLDKPSAHLLLDVPCTRV